MAQTCFLLDIRRQPFCGIDVGDGTSVVTLCAFCDAPVEEGGGVAGIELDGLVEVLDRLVVQAFAAIGYTPV
jgi:hypothetical protein